MAVTAITDIIEPTSFLKYTIEKTKDNPHLTYQSAQAYPFGWSVGQHC